MRSLCDDRRAFDDEVLNGMGRDGLAYGQDAVELIEH